MMEQLTMIKKILTIEQAMVMIILKMETAVVRLVAHELKLY